VFVKICGTTSEEDALLAVAMDADAVGFIFAPSPRQVAPDRVRDIVRRLPPEILTVGVFRNEAPERVVKIVQHTGLKAAQLHGQETPEQARFVRKHVPLVIQAFPAGDPALERAAEYGVDAVMIDNPKPGSGKLFDWSLADDVPPGCRLILAGGLTPENVGDAIERVRPWGVDAATGLEAEPGRKDARKVRAFVANARAAAPAAYEGNDLDFPYDWQDDDMGVT
jgi:phosphoribosylanthranilate isomerase